MWNVTNLQLVNQNSNRIKLLILALVFHYGVVESLTAVEIEFGGRGGLEDELGDRVKL